MTQLKELGIRNDPNMKIDVVVNERGRPINDASIALASLIGALVRNKISIIFYGWRDVDSTEKENLWMLVLLRYNLDDTHKKYVIKKMASSLRGYRCLVGTAVEKPLKLEEAKKKKKSWKKLLG